MTEESTAMDLRSQLAGQNRLELLLFGLVGRQRFGINVFKVKEVMACPHLTDVPGSHSVIRGVAHMRGQTIPVMDLCMAVGGPRMEVDQSSSVIITEFNRRVIGFLIGSVDRIINLNWEEVLPPPVGLGRRNYMTAVTRVNEELVEIIDVEKVLNEVMGADDTVSSEVIEDVATEEQVILVVDDSVVALNQIKRVLEQIGVQCVSKRNGREALDQLKEWAEDGDFLTRRLALVISDIEMPQMDGYTFVTELRKDPNISGIHVILHSSVSGGFNKDMVAKVGADEFISKFEPDELAQMVIERLKAHKEVA